jgi:hypothetical protein
MSVVTLVHGTWATAAAWCSPQSKLCATIGRALGDETIFAPFTWSGKNSHRARTKAAVDLQQHIREIKQRHPRDEHFLVAHSHGGNVCLYALRDVEIHSCITGTITMSTPFIVCRRRNLGASSAAAITVFFLGILMLIGTVQFANVPIVPRSFLLVGALLGSLVMMGGLDSLLRRILFKGKSHTDIYASWRDSFALPKLSATELLIVRSTGYEATGALAVSHVVAWALSVLSRLFDRVFRAGEWVANTNNRYSPARRAAYAAGPLLFGAVALWYTFVHDIISSPIMSEVLSLAGWVLVATAIGFIRAFGYDLYGLVGFTLQALCGALLLPIVIVLMLCVLPFGSDTAIFGVLFEISAESSPPGTFTIFHSAESVAGLSHSAPYDSDEALLQVAAWVRAAAGRSPDGA